MKTLLKSQISNLKSQRRAAAIILALACLLTHAASAATPDVTVTLSDFTADHNGADFVVRITPTAATGGTAQRQLTDANGLATFTAVAPGVYSLTIENAGVPSLEIRVPDTAVSTAASGIVISEWTAPGPASSPASPWFRTIPYLWPGTQGAASTVLKNDGSGNLTWGTAAPASGIDAADISAGDVSNTEFDYLNGVTSALQTQLSAKPNINPTDGYLPYRGISTAFSNSPLYRISATRLGFNGTNFFMFSDSANGNLALGDGTMEVAEASSSDNVAIGRDSMPDLTTGDQNVMLGGESGFSLTTGGANVGIGFQALQSVISGEDNVAVGAGAGISISTGIRNIAVGFAALSEATTGEENVVIGRLAGNSISTGIRNTTIGNYADAPNTTNSTAIGYNAVATLDNQVVLGSDDVTDFKFGLTELTADELSYLSGVSSSLQTQIAGKQAVAYTANTTYYVRTDGSDANTGTANTAGSAWLTIHKAVDTITQRVIPRGITITISVADGTYAITNSIVLAPFAGAGAAVLQGNVTTNANVIITGASSSSIISASVRSDWTVQGFQLKATAGTVHGIFASGGWIKFGAIDFSTGLSAQLKSNVDGLLSAISAYTVSGAAAYHINVTARGTFTSGQTCTLTGTLNFSSDFAFFDQISYGGLTSASFTGGTITGKRYESNNNSFIHTGTADVNFFPGDVAGTTATGGLYD